MLLEKEVRLRVPELERELFPFRVKPPDCVPELVNVLEFESEMFPLTVPKLDAEPFVTVRFPKYVPLFWKLLAVPFRVRFRGLEEVPYCPKFRTTVVEEMFWISPERVTFVEMHN